MEIFRGMIVGVLIFWLSLPLPLFISPETSEYELMDRPMVHVLSKKQQTQKSHSGFLSKLKSKAKSIRSMNAPLLFHQVMVDDLIKIEQVLKLSLFYFWQGLIKPTRQLLWQMTTQMQRSLMKKMAGAYPKDRFILYLEDVSHKIETVLDR